jgi:hypothetical protein
MTREYDTEGYRTTMFATERRYPCGTTRQVVSKDWEEARRLLSEELSKIPDVSPAR